ncbi:MAG TPA: tetratricopeptide repeat protein [Candidatus Dormibacteraeota bacterium]|nr:tetratricopeptide repeat protein [Candidatus Dormibacteraeota bacterium]
MKQGHRLLTLALAAGALTWCAAAAAKADDITFQNAAISTISDPNHALRFARDRIAAHDLPGAVLALQRYIINHPEEGAVEGFLGDLYVSNGDFHDAELLYRQMLVEYPLDRSLHTSLGKLYTVENRVDEAIAQFQESLPDIESAYYLVLLHQRKGDLVAFREQMRRNAQQHPNDVNAQLDAAQLFGALYLPRDAALEFQRAVAIDPNSLEALEGLGLAQVAERANDAAEQTLTHCLTLDPSNYGCLDALGLLEIQERNYDQAQAALDHAYRLAPEAPEALLSMGRLNDARGEWQAAVTDYERALYVWPYGADAYVNIAFDDEEHGMLAQAQQEALKGLSLAPADARLHYMLGYLYRKVGRRDLAVAQFLAAEESLDPQIVQFAKESVEELQQP